VKRRKKVAVPSDLPYEGVGGCSAALLTAPWTSLERSACLRAGSNQEDMARQRERVTLLMAVVVMEEMNEMTVAVHDPRPRRTWRASRSARRSDKPLRCVLHKRPNMHALPANVANVASLPPLRTQH
jgi:hypothetical protein